MADEWETVAIGDGTPPPNTEQPSAGDVFLGGMTSLIPAYGDEIAAGGNAALSSVIGGPNYEQSLAQVRQAQKSFQDNSGVSDITNIGSALLLPFGAVKAAGGSVLGNALRAAGIGGAGGGAYGFGEGEDGFLNRMEKAGNTALTGASFGAGGVGALEGLSAVMRTRPVSWLLNNVFKGEQGSVLPNIQRTVTPESEAPATNALAKYAREYTPDQLRAGVDEMKAARADNVPLFLAEALPAENMQQAARYFANSQGGRDVFQTALKERKAQTYDRLSDMFNTVSKQTDVDASGKAISNAAAGVLKAAREERTKAADPLYKKAFVEYRNISDPDLKTLIDDSGIIQREIAKVREISSYKKLKDTNLRLLDKVKQRLDDQYEKKAGTREAGDIWKEREKLVEILDKDRPLYPQARAEFEKQSRNLEGLNNAALDTLANLNRGEFAAAGDKIFKLPAPQIRKLKALLTNAEDPEIAAANEKAFIDVTRAHIQKILDDKGKNRDALLDKLFNSKRGEDQLIAAIGPDGYADLKRVMQYEQQVASGNRAYDIGPRTSANLVENANQGTLLKALLGGPLERGKLAISKLSMPRDQSLQRDLAVAFSNPEEAIRLMENYVIPMVQDYSKGASLANALLNKGTPAIERAAAGGAPSVLLNALQAPE